MKKLFIFAITCLIALSEAVVSNAQSVTLDALTAELDRGAWKKCLLNEGNEARLVRFFDKLEKGQKISVGAIGGSITMGALASREELRWANQVYSHLCREYPEADISFYNAGVGATNSLYGALRAYEHLLKYEPDLVLFEYSINDSGNPIAAETSEGLLRQILSMKNKPAVVMVGMMNAWGKNVQEIHVPLAEHYEIPFISFRNFIEPKINAGVIDSHDVIRDEVHPNDKGHQVTGHMVSLVLDEARKSGKQARIGRLPEPLYPQNKFQYVKFHTIDQFIPADMEGWNITGHPATKSEPWRMYGKRIIEKVYHASAAGATMEFTYKGTYLALVSYLYKAGDDWANAKVTIDGQLVEEVPGVGEQTWGGIHRVSVIGKELGYGKHKVRIEIVPDADGSVGDGFDIVALAYGLK